MATIADSTPFKPAASSRSLARRLRLNGFLGWWMHELAAALPARLRAGAARRRARPVLAFDGNCAALWQPRQANGELQMKESARIALDGDPASVAAAGRNALAPLASAAGGAAPQVIVALSPRASLRKTLTLPAALEDHLHQSLAYDLDRHTPFKAEELYFDAAIVDRDATHNALRVDLAAARRSIVDSVLRQAESFGARVIAVVVDPPARAAASRLNLLPEDRRLPATHWKRWQVALPAALVALGALAALYLPIWQSREEVIALHRMADEARGRATASDALRSELERRTGEYNFALERKYAFPGAVQVLDDVTRILPDDTWLTQFELRAVRGKDGQRELTLRGESANAGRLVSLLEESRLFAQAAPRSPTTKIQPGPGEIFDVGAQLKPLPKPDALPLDMTPPAPVARAAPPAAAASRPAVPAGPSTTAAAAPNAAPSVAAPTAGAPVSAPAAAPAAKANPAAAGAPEAPAAAAPAPAQSAGAARGAFNPASPAAALRRRAAPGSTPATARSQAPRQSAEPAAEAAQPAEGSAATTESDPGAAQSEGESE